MGAKLMPQLYLGGMDECDTASLMYQCGKEQAPNLVKNAIKVSELSPTVVILTMPNKFKHPERIKNSFLDDLLALMVFYRQL
jgi:hypothetical protein